MKLLRVSAQMAIRLTEETTSGSCFTSVLCVFCPQSYRIFFFASERSGFNFKVNAKEILFSINGFSVTLLVFLEAKADTRKILSIINKKQGMGKGRSKLLD